MNGKSSFIGGTELMWNSLNDKVFPLFPELKDWNWIIAPGEVNIRKDGKNIAWIHLGEFEGDLSWICDPLIKHVIFVSYYQYQRFTEMYPDLCHSKCHVIRNAIDPVDINHADNFKTRLIFHSEPYRGLDVLLEALSLIHDDKLELHVFGDLDSDTIDWKSEFKDKIKKMCQLDSRVILHGRVENKDIRDFISTCHIFAYPSTWKETSCLSLIEALSAGLYCITNSFTVLPETGSGYTKIYPFNRDMKEQAKILSEYILAGIKEVRSGQFKSDLQVRHINQLFSWQERIKDWEQFAKSLK